MQARCDEQTAAATKKLSNIKKILVGSSSKDLIVTFRAQADVRAFEQELKYSVLELKTKGDGQSVYIKPKKETCVNDVVRFLDKRYPNHPETLVDVGYGEKPYESCVFIHSPK